MLTPDEIREALLSLVEDEYEEEQMADIQKEYGDKIKRISLDLLALKYLKEAHIPNEYCVYSEEDPEGRYHGRRLFDLEAVMVASKKTRHLLRRPSTLLFQMNCGSWRTVTLRLLNAQRWKSWEGRPTKLLNRDCSNSSPSKRVIWNGLLVSLN